MKVRFIDYYALASNLVLATFVIGIAVIFIRGLDEVADLVISAIILSLRYFSVILIRRRFALGKYLLIILIARNIYRLTHAPSTTNLNTIASYLIITQIVLTILALILILRTPQKMINNIRKKLVDKSH